MVIVLAGCKSTAETYKLAESLNYEPEPDKALILEMATPYIKKDLKDPDSLKNLEIAKAYKCYASKLNFSDNVNPKYNYGYWCYKFTYNATNSYGGYVRGDTVAVLHNGNLMSKYQLGETVRNSKDIYDYFSQHDLED